LLNRAANSQLAPYTVEAFAAATACAYLAARSDVEVRDVLAKALEIAREGRPVMVDVAIDYSRKTWFTRGVVATNFWHLPWSERLRLLARALARRLSPR
jgi:acetolactate synthase-1/2/3 large subunit